MLVYLQIMLYSYEWVYLRVYDTQYGFTLRMIEFNLPSAWHFC